MSGFKSFVKNVSSILDASAKSQLPFMVALFFLSALLDMLGVGLVGGFVALALKLQHGSQSIPLVGNYLVGADVDRLVLFVGLGIILIFCIKAIVSCLVQKKIALFSFGQQARLQSSLMKVYMRTSYEATLSRSSSFMINVLQYNVVQFVNSVLMPVLQLVTNTVTVLFLSTFLLYTSPIALISMMLFFGLLLFCYDRLVRDKLRAAGAVAKNCSKDAIKGIQQGLEGLKEVRVLGCEGYFEEKVSDSVRSFAKNNGLNAVLQYIPRSLIESAMVVFIVGLFLVYMTVKGNALAAIQVLTIFLAAGIRVMPAISQIMASISRIRFGYSVVEQLKGELDRVSRLKGAIEDESEARAEKEVFSVLSFVNVSYMYPGAKVVAMNGVTLTIRKGESVGVVGPSGAGKTTLIDLLLGLLMPQMGHIEINGRVVREGVERWRNKIAYIPQTIFILDDTLRRNIALGVEDVDIDQGKLDKAIADAQLREVVVGLPEGVNTVLGEHGVRLSGGQRQRVALARAFYHDRDIIVMDEATSALDTDTEEEVVNAIRTLKGKKTMIVIAHRVSTIQHCDRLYRLDKGCLTAVGTYQEVIGV
jgi:ABC-type multidrug transport system fused ATPase/permease subunit